MRRTLACLFVVCMFLVSCGYHLAGHGRGVVPEDVHVLDVTGTDVPGDNLVFTWRRYVSDHALNFTVGEAGADAQLRLENVTESFTPITFDVSGVATSYRLVRSARLSLWRKDALIWSSGEISAQGEVYAVGGPASIDASKARLRRDLNRQWVRNAWLKLTSGF